MSHAKKGKTQDKSKSDEGMPIVPIKTTLKAGAFPVVGIGASAGGLKAFESFFSGMPADIDTGMAFILVQHLAPDHESILTDLIRRYTRMQVFEVEDGMVVKPDCAYIIPPNRDMAFLNGTLQLMEPVATRGMRLPIDFFFRSLAQDQHELSIGVILSGSGCDGTQGVRAIKDAGGMVIAQNLASSEYDGMPRSAIETGLVDYELTPAEMPGQILSYVSSIFNRQSFRNLPIIASDADNALKKIFVLLRDQTSHDFSQYKPTTILRRIERRMGVHQIKKMSDYVKYLQQMPIEVDALFRDMLIGVTSFFRDPEAFKVLEELVIPQLFANKPAGSVIRVWLPGCSTGEEAYSIAILLIEHQEKLKKRYNFQIFATDIDSTAIAKARVGIYPVSITADISPERLARFFEIESGSDTYRIHKSIRDLLVFSEHDLIKDPPFSRLDLLSCRNLLIYMTSELQRKTIPLFSYALKPGGFLFLGTSETVGEYSDIFSSIDSKLRLYQRKDNYYGARHPNLSEFLSPIKAIDITIPIISERKTSTVKVTMRELTEQILLQQVNPTAILVNSSGNILYLHGRTGQYLEPAPGETGINNILKMAREGLELDLTIALHKASTSQKLVRCPGLRVKTNSHFTSVNLSIHPITSALAATVESPLFLVILEEAPPVNIAASDNNTDSNDTTDAKETVKALKMELRSKEEYLQSANDQLATSNEELKSTNEEMQSVNEELQSTNEELETSREELQSLNEELSTVNAELQAKVGDLSRANNDMNNLLAGTGIGTVFVDHALRILRFTPTITKIINLISGDIGRPVSHIVSNLIGYNTMEQDVRAVLDTLVPKEMETQTKKGEWYTMRILPYRTVNNVIEGAVITFVDITERKKAKASLQETGILFKKLFENSLSAVAIHEMVFDEQGKPVDFIYLEANAAFEKHTGLRIADVIGKKATQVFPGIEKTNLIEIYGKVALTGESKSFDHFFEFLQRQFHINAYQVGKSQFAVVFEGVLTA